MRSSVPSAGTYLWARAILVRTGFLHRRAIGLLLKDNPGQALPSDLLEASVTTLLGQGRRGPKLKRNHAALDFDVVPRILERFHEKLPEFKAEDKRRRADAKAAGRILPRGEAGPASVTWDFVRAEFESEIGAMSVAAFRNLVSTIMRVPGWQPPDSPPTFEEIEATWHSQNSTPNPHDGSRRRDRVQPHAKKRKDAK
jgi:hypothetical protein